MAKKRQKYNHYSNGLKLKIVMKYLNGKVLHEVFQKNIIFLIKEYDLYLQKKGHLNNQNHLKGRKKEENIDYKERYKILKKETLYNNNISSMQEYIQLVEQWILLYNTTRLKPKK